MVSIFTGLGAGFERGSGASLGSSGLLGSGSLGRNGEQLSLNAATGNFLIGQQDEFLVGRGPDSAIARTYNSMGDFSDENGDNWRQSTDRRIYGLTGTVNTVGSTIKRVSSDGSEITYSWNASASAYVATDGAGAYDKLTYGVSGVGEWKWTDGDSQITETYKAHGVSGLTGTVNTAGSTVTRVLANGTRSTYSWDAATSKYIVSAGTASTDNLTYAGGTWIWSNSGNPETQAYSANGASWRIASQSDTSGNTLTFAYAGAQLTRVTTADGSYEQYSWSGNNITQIVTGYTDLATSTAKTLTRTRYGYDGSNRLTTVTVDLSPGDNSVTDGKTYVTTYTYDGTSDRIASISETDGSSIAIAYDASGRAISFTQTAATGDTRVTTITYNVGSTLVTDPLGYVTQFNYNANGTLNRLFLPGVRAGAPSQNVNFTYNSNGDLLRAYDQLGHGPTYTYDASGNILTVTDIQSNVTTRTYGSKNELLTETQTGSDGASGSVSHTTRYVYDGSDRLAFTIDPTGRVTRFYYDSFGNRTRVEQYPDQFDDVSAMAPSFAPILDDMMNWDSGLTDRSNVENTVNSYDVRGNLVSSASYATATVAGATSTADGYAQTNYVYDQAGRLLSRTTAGLNTETFIYDGMGRIIASTDLSGGTTSVVFNDGAMQTVITLASGLTQTSVYNKAGDLLSYTEAGANVTSGTTTYVYDRDGRARIITDATGHVSYVLYDHVGRKVGDVDQAGYLTEYMVDAYGYDMRSGVDATVRYSTPLPSYQMSTLQDPNADIFMPSVRRPPTATDLWTWNVYDAKGRVIETINGDGGATTYQYDSAGNLVTTTAYFNKLTPAQISAFKTTLPTSLVMPAADADHDSVARNFYDKQGRLIGVLDGEGYFRRITYDNAGRKVAETSFATNDLFPPATNAGDRVTRYVYDGQGHLRFEIDASNHVTEYVYGATTAGQAIGVVRETIQYAGAVSALAGYKIGTVKAAVASLASDANNRKSWAVYDKANRLAYSIDATGAVTSYSYDSLGDVIKAVQFATIRVTTSLPDKATMDTWVTANIGAPTNRVTRNYYSARGELRYTVDAEGYVTRFDYDAAGRTVGTARWDAAIVTSDATTIANIATLATGTFVATATAYDNDGRIQSTTDGAGAVTSYVYNVNGTLQSVYRAYGTTDQVQTAYVYDNAGRVSARYDANGTADQVVTAFAYDGLGNLVSTTDPNSNVTTSQYDRVGRVLKTIDALNGSVVYLYNAFGEAVKITNERGSSTYNYYDALGRLQYVRDAQNYVTYNTYTVFGDLASVTQFYGVATGSASISTPPTYPVDSARDATTNFEYDRLGRLTKIVDPLGSYEQYTLNAFGNRGTVRDKFNTITTNTFDHRGALKTSVVDSGAGGKAITTSFDYGAVGNVTKITDALLNKTTKTYDANGRLLSVTDAKNHSTFYSYDTRGNLAAVKNSIGKYTRYAYDDLDRLVYTVDALGGVTQNSYDAAGNVSLVRSYATPIALTGLGIITGADTIAARVVLVPGKDKITYSFYDAKGQLRYSVDALGFLTEFNYDAAGNLIRETAYSTKIPATAVYTTAGIQDVTTHMSQADLNNAQITRYVYNSANRLGYTIDAIGDVTTYSYDMQGNVVKQQRVKVAYSDPADPSVSVMRDWVDTYGSTTNDYISRSIFDQNGRLRFAIDTERYVTQYTYDAAGNALAAIRYKDQYTTITASTTLADAIALVGITPPVSAAVTSYLYDSAGRLYDTEDAEHYHTRLVLDSLGRATDIKAAFGTPDESVTHRDYDAVGNLTDETFDDGTKRHTAYDLLGRVTDVTDAYGTLDASTTHRIYDAVGNLTDEIRGYTLPEAAGKHLTYDAFGQVVTETNDIGGSTIRHYDVLGQLQDVSVQFDTNNSGLTTNTYDAFGNLIQVVDPLGNTGYFYYDRLNRLTLQVDPERYATGTTYTLTGKIATVRRYATKATWPAGTTDLAHTVPMVLITASQDSLTQFTYDKLDRVKTSIDAENFSESYGYDAFGDRTTVTGKSSGLATETGGTTTNVYDKRGLLLSETFDTNNVTNSYTYDGRGNRKTMIEADGLPEHRNTTYTYDKLDRLIIKTVDAVSVANATFTAYVNQAASEYYDYDKRGNLIRSQDANGTKSFTYYDALDRKTAEINAVGTLTTYELDDAGNTISTTVFDTAIALPLQPGGPPPIGTGTCRKMIYNYDRNNRLTSVVQVGVPRVFVDAQHDYHYNPSTDNYTYYYYDAAGNLAETVDARGYSSFSYYNKLGQKVAQVDEENYLTTYDLDQNGNVTKELRYATRLAGTPARLIKPTLPTTSSDDRVTDFTYDRDGRRLTETRENVSASTVFGDTVNTTTSSATITYTYNGLGEILVKTEANSDYTRHTYDKLGREIKTEQKSYADYRGVTVTPTTDTSYNGLNMVSDTIRRGEDNGSTADDRVTHYVYGAGGRLISITDSSNFTTNSYYDKAGQLIAQTYRREKSDGSLVTEGNFYSYDAAGRETSRKAGVLNGISWAYGDTTDEYYNSHGEVVARGTNTGGNKENAQQFAEYDQAGHVWRTNFGDGIVKAYAYDSNGNATILYQSFGTADLKSYVDFGAIFDDAPGKFSQTFSVFDMRNQLISTTQTRSDNAGADPVYAELKPVNGQGVSYYDSNGQIVSPSNAYQSGPAAQLSSGSPASVVQAYAGGISVEVSVERGWSARQTYESRKLKISAPTNAFYGGGLVHVSVTDGAGTRSLGDFYPGGVFEVSDWRQGPYVAPIFSGDATFTLTQTIPNGDIFLGQATVAVQAPSQDGPDAGPTEQITYGTISPTPTLKFFNENVNATVIRMFVRPAGSNGAYSEFNATQVKNTVGSDMQGWFTYDLNQPPFYGLPANSGWDVKYLAMDGAGNVHDSRQGSLSVDGNGNLSQSSFSPVNVGGPGQAWMTHDGNDYLILAGLPSNVATLRMYYRTIGSPNWSGPIYAGPGSTAGAAAYGQKGLWSFTANGLGGPVEYWLEQLDGNGALMLPNKLYGTFTTGGTASDLTSYVDGSRAIILNPPPGKTVTSQEFRYFQNGAWSNWIPHSGGDSWMYDAAGLANFYADISYPIQYRTYNGDVLVSFADATLTLGYNGQSVTPFVNAVSIVPKVLFAPKQTDTAYIILSWRDEGSTDNFTATTISKVGGVFGWDVDADHVRPTGGTGDAATVRKIEYFYDAYAADGVLLPPLNGDDHATGYLAIKSDQYGDTANNQIEWSLHVGEASSYLIQRAQNYNAFGEIVSETDGNDHVTSFNYNTLGELVRKTSPQVNVTDEHGVTTRQTPIEIYSYDVSGRLVGKMDANHNLVTQTLLAGSGHDGNAALSIGEFHPDGGQKTFGYDIFGDLRKTTDELFATVTNAYDKAGRLIEVDHAVRSGGNTPGTQLIDKYAYDGLGQRIRHTNSVYGSTFVETTDYDVQGRVKSTKSFGGLLTQYAYSWYGATGPGITSAGGWQTDITNSAGLTSHEKDGLFGQIIWRQDFGGNITNYTYNLLGQLVQQTGVTTRQSVSFTYYGNGYIASITDNAEKMKSTFEYDDEGNRTLETYNSTDASPIFYQNAAVTYDELNRVVEFKDGKADITYKYDANGNRREVNSVYNDGVGGHEQTQDYWYAYDPMNRFTMSMGTLSGAGPSATIVVGDEGVAITYDAVGNRKTATYGGTNPHLETYTYTADGFLENTIIGGAVVATRTNDALGRVTNYTQSGASALTRAITYDKDNRVIDETDTDVAHGGVQTVIHNDYRLYGPGGYTGADQGVITHSRAVKSGVTTDTNYYYQWWDEAKQTSVKIGATDPSNPNTGQWGAGFSQFSYDKNGHLLQVVDAAGGRVLHYENDAYGQVLIREEHDSGVLGPRQQYYYFNGHRIGDVGNNGKSESLVDYAQELAVDRGAATSTSGFRYGKPVASADFDENYQPINSGYPGLVASSYTVQGGDTLQSIAQAAWGDATLWYLIADANGLTSRTVLVTGQTLSIPNKVTNFHNTSKTFRVYNPGEAIGDTLPTLPPMPAPPPPAKAQGCGVMGAILLAVIAVAVVAVTAGAAIAALAPASSGITGIASALGAVAAGTTGLSAGVVIGVGAAAGAIGSIASQGVGVATGLQDKFSWKGVALSALSGAVGAGLGPSGVFGQAGLFSGVGSKFAQGALNGAVGSSLSQGVAAAAGLQSRFDWTAVAAAGIGAGVATTVGGSLRGVASKFGRQFLTTASGGFANAAARSLISGTDFGDNVMAALPDIIGNTIGNLVADDNIRNDRRSRPGNDPRSAPTLPGTFGAPGAPRLQVNAADLLNSDTTTVAGAVRSTGPAGSEGVMPPDIVVQATWMNTAMAWTQIGWGYDMPAHTPIPPQSGYDMNAFQTQPMRLVAGPPPVRLDGWQRVHAGIDAVGSGIVSLATGVGAIGSIPTDPTGVGALFTGALVFTSAANFDRAYTTGREALTGYRQERVGASVIASTTGFSPASAERIYTAAEIVAGLGGGLRATPARAGMAGGTFDLGVSGSLAADSAFSARSAALRDAFTDANGNLVSSTELRGLKYTIRGVEAQGYQLTGAIKYGGNQGIDLAFQGVGNNAGRYALAEGKASVGLNSLSTDSLGIRQGSEAFFRTRLTRAGEIDLRTELLNGNVDLFGGFSGPYVNGATPKGRLFQFDPSIFTKNENLRTTPGAAVRIKW